MPLHSLMFMFTSVESGTIISLALGFDLPDEDDCLLGDSVRFDHECPCLIKESEVFGVDTFVEIVFGGVGLQVDVLAVYQ
jgi:hypothetical protein